jgi:hypothetical protein
LGPSPNRGHSPVIEKKVGRQGRALPHIGRRSRSDRFRRKRGVCIQKRWGGEADQIDLRKTGCCIQKRWGGEADQIDLRKNGMLYSETLGRRSRSDRFEKNGMLYSKTLGRRSRSDRFKRKRAVCIQKRWGGGAVLL